MSSAVLPEPSATNRSILEILLARISVGIAFAACLLPPQLLRSLMEAIVAGGKRPTLEQAERDRALVVSVSTLCAGEGCLPRSVATAILSRLHGHGLTWCTGIRQQPFLAHAWVEVAKSPVGEVTSLEGLRIMLRTSPRYATTDESDT